MTDYEKRFCAEVRAYLGVCVVSEGTRPIRIRAYPRGTDWQGWYGKGKTRVEAYISLIQVMCRIPAWTGPRDPQVIVLECKRKVQFPLQTELLSCNAGE